jgi:hypothetical protein
MVVAKRLRCTVGVAVPLSEGCPLEGLYDEPHPGAPRKASDAQIEQVVIETLENTPRGQRRWSTRSVARATGVI